MRIAWAMQALPGRIGISVSNDVFELRQLFERYPNGTLANDGTDIDARLGEIHAIVGENGASKSTVMKMLYGLEQPSAGEILLDGKPVIFRRPSEAIAAAWVWSRSISSWFHRSR